MSSNQDALIRVFTALSSLRKNIGSMKLDIVSEIYISEYHSILEKLKNIGIDITDFYIPDSARQEYTLYGDEKCTERTYFMTKIDAILGYFEIINSPEPKRIGFRKLGD